MMKFYHSSTTLAFFIFIHLSTFAQDIHWNSSPQKGFVFQINNKEAQKLLTITSPDTIFNGLLHTQIDTFDVKKGWLNRPAKGHFILATIVENKLHCEYTSVFPYQVFLLKEYNALALQVLDLDGNLREDAIVKLKLRRLRIDGESKTYPIENAWFNDNNKIVTVELDGFRSVFNVEKHDVPSWYSNYNDDEGPSFYSYMITDKNKYKPGEKVRYKSYALSQSRSPMNKELELWMSYGGNSIRVGKTKPHRPGSYASEFMLHDSLKLVLDRNYNLQLKEKNGRVVSSANLKFEDYELNGNRLEVRLSTDKQFHPNKNELSVTATDANGLLLKDAKASIVVKAQSIRETFQTVVILKDTLFFTEVDLDPNETTTVDIPSHLFEKTNTSYEVHVRVRDNQNQIMDRIKSATHYYSQFELTTSFSNDSIIYEMLKNGIPVGNIPMSLRHDDEAKAIEVTLPYKEKINPVVSQTYLRGDLVSKQISMSNLIPRLELQGGILKDTFNIHLINPQKIEVSWYIYQGSELLQKGFGNELDYKSFISDRTQTYYVELLFSFGGVEHVKRKDYEFREDILNVSFDVPERVYPGQQTDAIINVNDQLGHPVSGVDLTALAVSGKLGYYLPDLPYYGKSSSPRSMQAHYSKSGLNKRLAILDLDYKKWESRAGLDTMKYYQFTYPKSRIFSHSLTIADSTQFAPYVMQNGAANPVYVIEVNRKPVYYSWVDQPNKYSFHIPNHKKVSITLRLYDRVLLFDSLSFPQGKKTILSVDLDNLPESVKMLKIDLPVKKSKHAKVYPSFTKTEIDRHLRYISSFKNEEGTAYLESGNEFTPLFQSQNYLRKDAITVGPITPGKQTFTNRNGLHTTYQHEGGFTYAFEDNIVYKLNAEKLIPERLYNTSFKPMSNVNDRVMTRKAFLESSYVPANVWHPRSINLIDQSIYIKVLLPEEKEDSGFASILFENCGTGKITSPCQNQYGSKPDFYTIPRGYHHIIAIYNNGTYLRMDSINLKSYSKVVIDLNEARLHSLDSLSRKWLEVASRNCYGAPEPRIISMRQSGPIHGNIKGVVYDESNFPLPGANVIIKGTMNGTVTDADGHFALDSDESVTILVISFIGYKTEEIEVQVGSEVSVSMMADVMQLQEVVVTGYGIQLRESLSASLSGRVSGVSISAPETDYNEVEDITKQEAEERLYQDLLTLNTIRSRFSDVGFWEPKLFTDKQGQSTFKITFPDDITRWEATVYAMNRHLQTGTARKSIKSYKPIMAELRVPQFLTQGDSSFFIGNISNYTQDKNISGAVTWGSLRDEFEKEIQFSEFFTDKFPVNATTTDSIKSRYVFTRDDGYLDGEERTVPVVEQGIIRADGSLSILKNNEDVHVKASAVGNVTIEILSNQIDIYAGEARYLLSYKYDCNEQLASKLLGLVNYRMLMAYEGQPFKYDKDVNKIIARLLKNQNEEFLWSWWDVSPATSYWMSSHILRALKAANDAGYKVDLNIGNIASKAEYKFDILNQYALSDADLLHALASWNAKLDYSKHLASLDTLLIREQRSMSSKNKRYYSPYSLLKEKFLVQEIRQIVHLPYNTDTLLRYQKHGILGDVHFSDGKAPRSWYDDNLAINAIAYRIARRDSLLRKLVEPMQMYFINQRNKEGWNTYHSSNILTTILPDLIAAGASKKQQTTVTLSGKVNASVDKFPYRLELQPEEEIRIRKESGLPAYFMQYRKERVVLAKTGVEGFEIKTTFANNQSVVEAGKPVTLIVELQVSKEANLEYVMIEVPIPGACSYADKTQNNNQVETHREYFKDRTVIFCENMKSGSYSFEIKLLPRFTGKYLINPAQVSLMYVPVVNANTDIKRVRVE
jgi:alpha-2-macroglobulin